ncbi:hypothetical protein Q9S36_36470 [Microbacterium sp. ARD31]|uniref:hypothetical protein n=1 Tax=Microbacterium sp. ARD31 TaxID=2962576 RepID=UPI002881BFC1|nr:hypothetical protein [Microbacterium sp. ARD31]MDT0185696.1 hypothetical protein [Microbacterium sp. ARD31]
MAEGDMTFRAVFPEWDRAITFEDVHDLLARVEALVWVGVVNTEQMRHDQLGRSKVGQTLVERQTIHSIRYASPFEILFSITAATGAVSAAGVGLLSLWNKYQDARMKTASADTFVSAHQLIRDHLQLQNQGGYDVRQIDLAASAIGMLEVLEPVEDQESS